MFIILLAAIFLAGIKVISDHISGKKVNNLSSGIAIMFLIFDTFEVSIYNWNAGLSIIRFLLFWFTAMICCFLTALAVGNIKKKYYNCKSKEKESESKVA